MSIQELRQKAYLNILFSGNLFIKALITLVQKKQPFNMLCIETILFQLALFISTSTVLLTLADKVLNSLYPQNLQSQLIFTMFSRNFPLSSPLCKIFKRGLRIYLHIDNLANLATKLNGKECNLILHWTLFYAILCIKMVAPQAPMCRHFQLHTNWLHEIVFSAQVAPALCESQIIMKTIAFCTPFSYFHIASQGWCYFVFKYLHF